MRKSTVIAVLIIMSFAFISVAHGEVTLDGTIGKSGALSGPNYVISQDMGKQMGSNLFHSFGKFDVFKGESASFTGSNSINNVIGRVTGGSFSTIDGTVRCAIPGANLFLLNPSGIMFGTNASLDVNGSFTATTASYIKFGDGGRFDATSPGESLLTSAAPSAFGFLSSKPAAISTDNSSLQVPAGKSLSLIGGNISLTNSHLSSSGGRVDLVSVASSGEVSRDMNVGSFDKLGTVNITNTTGDTSSPNISVSGEKGGEIFIRSGKFVLDNGVVFNATSGPQNGGDIDIGASEELLVNGALISTKTSGSGKSGDVKIDSPDITISGGSYVGSSTTGSGAGGNINVTSNNLNLGDGSVIGSLTTKTGNGGAINIKTPVFKMNQGRIEISSEGVDVDSGSGGSVTVEAKEFEMTNGSEIAASSFGSGKGGNVSVEAGKFSMNNALILSNAQGTTADSGQAGDIKISSDSLEMKQGAQIASVSQGPGKGGNIDIATERLTLASADILSNAEGETGGSGDAGNIKISSTWLDMSAGSQVAAVTFGSGKGGNVVVSADHMTLSGFKNESGQSIVTGIFASAVGQSPDAGDGGSVHIYSKEISLLGGAQIDAETYGYGQGGAIYIKADSLALSNSLGIGEPGSPPGPTTISTATYGKDAGCGNAGNVQIDAETLTQSGITGIFADTEGTGNGGNIKITATKELSLQDGSSIAVGSTGTGAGGELDIRGGVLSISGVSKYGYASGVFAGSFTRYEDYPGTGNAGNINVNADVIKVSDGGTINTEAEAAGGGKIKISADSIQLTNTGGISSSVFNGEGGGGDIQITSGSLLALGKSDITANASDGFGGHVIVNSDAYIHSADSRITASSNISGRNGIVEVKSPTLDMASVLYVLPSAYASSARMVEDSCEARRKGVFSSFILTGRGLAPAPGEIIP